MPATGMAVLHFDPKTGFPAAISPNVDRSGRNLAGLLYGIHLWVQLQFDPDRCIGGSRPNVKDFVFYYA